MSASSDKPTPGDVLADAVEDYLFHTHLNVKASDRWNTLRLAVDAYRRDTAQILADTDESLRTPAPPPTPPEGTPETDARIAELRSCLIIAMDKLHRHVVHAGTEFEDRALAAARGKQPTRRADYHGYGNRWKGMRDEEKKRGA